MSNKPKLQFLYTNIGRGHPFYLDGIAEGLIRAGEAKLIRHSTDVFTQSRFFPRQVWRLARLAYCLGSSAGLVGLAYNRFRKTSDYNRPSSLIRLAGRDLVRSFGEDSSDPLLVAHPVLVGILSGRLNLIYQHGEGVAPPESLVRGAAQVLVPTEAVALQFQAIGYRPEQLLVTGLCVEAALVRQASDAIGLRLRRFDQQLPLTGVLFSSGAEPAEHIKLLVSVARSLIMADQKVILFVRTGGRLERKAARLAASTTCDSAWITTRTNIPRDLPPLSIISSSSRREEGRLAALLFPKFDFLVAPPHERTNWAIGLGLPMFPLAPHYGSYAPLNFDLLLTRGVAVTLAGEKEAQTFGERIVRMKQEKSLTKMAQAGWGRERINGFAVIAEWLRVNYS